MPPWFDWSAPNKSSILHGKKSSRAECCKFMAILEDMTQLSNTNGILDFFAGTYSAEQYYVDNCRIQHLMYISHRIFSGANYLRMQVACTFLLRIHNAEEAFCWSGFWNCCFVRLACQPFWPRDLMAVLVA